MRVVSYIPPAPLGAWIASIWYFEGPDLPNMMERILPDARMQLLVNLTEDTLRWWNGRDLTDENGLSGAAIAGAFARPFAIDSAQQRAITGVSFTPGGAAAFFVGSMQQFVNDHVSLSEIPGCGSIRDDLLEAQSRSPNDVIRSWMRFLHKRYKPDQCRNVRVALTHLEAGVSVQQVADRMSISVRKLRNDFSSSVGLSPKAYTRVHRLQRLARSAAKGDPDWARLAVEHGYFDQAHMNHDFKDLTGITPTNYHPRGSEDWNHLILD